MQHSINRRWPKNFHYRVVGRNHGSSGLSSFTIALEAWRRGLTVTFKSKDLYLYSISDGYRTVNLNFSRPDSITSREDYTRLNDKAVTSDFLRKHNLPAPVGFASMVPLTELKLAELSEDIGFPLVLKIPDGSMGQGVLTGLNSLHEVRDAYRHLVENYRPKKIILEKHYTGEDYRILVVGNKAVAAVKRIPANVVGDGVSSIEQLIKSKNESRKYNPFLTSGLIKIDYEVEKCLADQSLTLESVIRKKQKIFLRRVANASAGGDVKDVTSTIPQAVLSAAEKAVSVFPGIFIAGVDVLLDEVTDEFVIIEINSRPQIGVNMYPTIGVGRDVPKEIIDRLFPGTQSINQQLEAKIRFDAELVRKTFRSGTVSEMTLTPIPLHRFPVRRVITLHEIHPLRIHQENLEKTILKLAAKEGISGMLRRIDNNVLKLYIAAGNEHEAEIIPDYLTRKHNWQIIANAEWNNAVTVGFHIRMSK